MEIDHASPTPLYEQIRDWVRSQIASGELGSNSRLPSERQLAEMFRVSRLTVTKALKELEWEGLVQSRVGKGTFVAPNNKIAHQLETLSSFTEYMTAQNKRVTSQIVSASLDRASKEIADALEIAAGAEIFVLERLRCVDGQAIALERAYLPHALCPDIERKYDFERESLYHVLREGYGLFLTSAQETVEARPASPYEAELLGIEAGDPVFGFTRTTCTDTDMRVEFVRSAYRGDCYKLSIELRSSGSTRLVQQTTV